MADEGSTQSTQDLPAVGQEAPPAQSPLQAQEAADAGPPPEALVGGAFAGGFVLAKLLKKLGGGGT
jgi:hypothetical protein